MMDLKTFLVAANNVHVAEHGAEFIYIGQDVVPTRWLAFFNGEEKELEFANSVDEAKVAAHRLFDSERCPVELQWKPIQGTAVTTFELDAPDLV